MNVFICCDLTGERKSILKNVILNIFKEKGLTRKLIGSAIMIIGAKTIILS